MNKCRTSTSTILILLPVIILLLIVTGFFTYYMFSNSTSPFMISDVSRNAIKYTNVEFYSISIGRSYRNDLSDDIGDKQYYYLSDDKVVIRIWGYGQDEVIDKETSISLDEFEYLRKEILELIQKYSILELLDSKTNNSSSEESYVTDQHVGTFVEIYTDEFELLTINDYPSNYEEMLIELDDILVEYK